MALEPFEVSGSSAPHIFLQGGGRSKRAVRWEPIKRILTGTLSGGALPCSIVTERASQGGRARRGAYVHPLTTPPPKPAPREDPRRLSPREGPREMATMLQLHV